MARRLYRGLAVVLGALAIGAPGNAWPATLADSVTATPAAAPSPGTFVARYGGYGDRPLVLEQFSLADGRPLAVAATLPEWPAYAGGPARAADGALWLTITTGPTCATNAMECAPTPDSCQGEIVRIDPGTSAVQTVYTAPPTVGIGEASPSPDGRSVAFLAGACNGYMGRHVVVRELASGRQSAVGARELTCHAIWPPAWNPGSSALAFSFGAATGPGHNRIAGPTCPAPRLAGLAVMRVRAAGRVGRPLAPAHRGCGYTAAGFLSDGIVAVEACGLNQLGPAYLVRLDKRLRRVKRFELPPGADPDTLAVDQRTGRVLITAYQVPQYTGTDQPASFVFVFAHDRLRLVRRYLGVADGMPANASW